MSKLPHGSIDALVSRGTNHLAEVYQGWMHEIDASIEEARGALHVVPNRVLVALHNISLGGLSRAVYETRMRAAMIGALDVAHEVATDKEKPTQFARALLLADGDAGVDTDPSRRPLISGPMNERGGVVDFVQMPYHAAVDKFAERVPMTKAEWSTLTQVERQRAFTVAGLAKDDFVAKVHEQLSKALKQSLSATEFRVGLDVAMRDAGYSPLNPSHANLVFRQNVSIAYNDGRKAQMNAKAVKATHAYREIHGVHDKGSRPTHVACHGLSFPADDPIWQKGPPFDFNCRCGMSARRTGSDEPSTGNAAVGAMLAEAEDSGYT